tara:strand:+ start:144 stop:353 length:210 start_codon:yes stop_codon:yes gene_type:complete
LKKHDDDDWDQLRPVKKVRVSLKRQPAKSYKHRHYEFLKSDDAEPMGLLDSEADEWLYRLFKPTTAWGK